MRGARLVGGYIFGGDNSVEVGGKPALGQGDDVPVAVGEQGKFPALSAQLRERCANIRKRRPVRNRRNERCGVIRFEVEGELLRRAPRRVGEHRAIALERPLALNLRFQRDVRVEKGRTVAWEQELAGGAYAVSPVDQCAKAIEGQPTVRHRLS